MSTPESAGRDAPTPSSESTPPVQPPTTHSLAAISPAPPHHWPPISPRFLPPVLLFILVLIAFSPAFSAGFVMWDDDDLLLHQTRYQSLTAENLHWMFTTSFAGHYQPLTWLSHALDFALWRGHPFGYHLTNVLLHALTAVAFYFLSIRILATAIAPTTPAPPHAPSPLFTSPSLGWVAFLSAALFALHPLRVESVVWIAERRDVLSGLFYVLSVAFYLRYIAAIATPGASNPAALRARRIAYVTSVALCALSLLSKAAAVTLPFVLMVLDRYPLRRPNLAGLDDSPRPPLWSDKMPFLVLAVAAGSRALQAQSEGGALYPLADHDWLARSAQAVYGLTFYLQKTLLPLHLGPLYQIPARDQLLGFTVALRAFLLLALIVTAWLTRRRCPALAAALAVYALIVAPVLGFAQSGPQLVADRYSYLSCLSLTLLAAGAVFRFTTFPLGRPHHPSPSPTDPRPAPITSYRPAIIPAAAFLLTALTMLTFRQSAVWHSPLALWTHALKVAPDSPIAWTNRADALAESAAFPQAISAYERALSLNPDDPIAHYHLGKVLELTGDEDAAMRHYLRSLSLDPNRPMACLALAHIFARRGLTPQALAILEDGLRRDPAARDLAAYLDELRHAPGQ